MFQPYQHIIDNNTFWVSPERCLYWEEQQALILADIHLGKTGHYRKEGIPVPQQVYRADLQRLISQLLLFKATRVIVVGDFTHTVLNKELELFKKWRHDFPLIRFDLVKGNHDILDLQWYDESGIMVHKKEMLLDRFCFRHEFTDDDPLRDTPAAGFVFSGHVHPGIKLSGKGMQTLQLPCFYFTNNHCILPAFSKFTGTYKVKIRKGDIVYIVTGREVIKKTHAISSGADYS